MGIPRSGESFSGTPVNVVIVDDEALFRDMLKVALSRYPQLKVIGDFADGPAALRHIPSLRPDVAILDIELGGPVHGVQLGIRLRHELPNLGIVLLSNYSYPEFLNSVPPEMAPSWSYLLKTSAADVDVVQRAVLGARDGCRVVDPQLSRRSPGKHGRLDQLTSRQRDILALIATGYSNAAIAARLHITEKSVENQINSIYQELDIDRQNSAVQPRVTATLIYWRETGKAPPALPLENCQAFR
ncbi:MAG: response regulator transcription factor [Firmicutes bacterium]|nr:response regulator transcription factor [Bacillota bacterium]